MADDAPRPDPTIVRLYYQTIEDKVKQLDLGLEKQREVTAHQLERLEEVAAQQMRELASAADQKIKEAVLSTSQQIQAQAAAYAREMERVHSDVLAMAKDLGEVKISHLKLEMKTDYALVTAKTVGSHLVKAIIGILTALLLMVISWYFARAWQTDEIVRKLHQLQTAPDTKSHSP